MEAVISRMKTVKTAESRATNRKEMFGANMRFLAISATIPNADDVSNKLLSKKETHLILKVRSLEFSFNSDFCGCRSPGTSFALPTRPFILHIYI